MDSRAAQFCDTMGIRDADRVNAASLLKALDNASTQDAWKLAASELMKLLPKTETPTRRASKK